MSRAGKAEHSAPRVKTYQKTQEKPKGFAQELYDSSVELMGDSLVSSSRDATRIMKLSAELDQMDPAPAPEKSSKPRKRPRGKPRSREKYRPVYDTKKRYLRTQCPVCREDFSDNIGVFAPKCGHIICGVCRFNIVNHAKPSAVRDYRCPLCTIKYRNSSLIRIYI